MRRTVPMWLLVWSSFLLPVLARPALACDRFERSGFGLFEQSRWFRYDPRTNTLFFYMKLRRVVEGVDPIFVQPFLKSGNFFTTILVLPRQPISLRRGECKTVRWRLKKPPELDLNSFFEYTDLEDENGLLQDYIWRTDRIEGTVAGSSALAAQVEIISWPMFNMATKTMTEPLEVVTSVDLSDALPGWEVIRIDPDPSTPFILYPGQMPVGTITLRRPAKSPEGVSIIRPRLIDTATGRIVQQVHLRFKVDRTKPVIIGTRASLEGEECRFRVVAMDVHSGVADAVEVHVSVNGGAWESYFLEEFEVAVGQEPVVVETRCLSCRTPTQLATRLGPFKPGDEIWYYFTVPDEAGNVVSTRLRRLLVPR